MLLSFERSATFHVFADVLNALFRILAGRIAESTLLRLDTEAFAATLYAGGHAALGWALAWLCPRKRLTRTIIFLVVFFAIDAAVFGFVWRHRGLPISIGWTLVAISSAVAALTLLGSSFLRRVFVRSVDRLFTWIAPVITLNFFFGAAAVSLSGPRSTEGELVADLIRVPTNQKVAILGVDGLDGRLVDEAIRQGRMPNLARLLESGSRGHLRSIRPPKSPVVWTSVATGALPTEHGIRDFVVRKNKKQIPVTSNLRKKKSLWNLAEEADFDVAFVNWYVTWPAEEVRGVMVSDRVDYSRLTQRVYPASLTAKIDSVRAALDDLDWRDPARFVNVEGTFDSWRSRQWGQVRRASKILDEVIRHDLVTLETGRAVLAQGQPDLTALYFRGNDNTQHLFWKYRVARDLGTEDARRLYPELELEDAEQLGDVIDRYYDFMDEILGEAVAMLEEGTALFVLSDHGFLTNNERSSWLHPNRLLAEIGLCELLPGEGGAADSVASRVFEAGTPTVGRVRTLRAGGAATSAEDALDEAWEVLSEARTDRDEPVFRSVELLEDEDGPYLRLEFPERWKGETISLGNTEIDVLEFWTPEGHSGDHAMNGFLLASGPPFREGGEIQGARVLDIAPTVLYLLGVPSATDLAGVLLEDLFDPKWRAAHPYRQVPTFGAREVQETELPTETEADDAIRAELEALGYL